MKPTAHMIAGLFLIASMAASCDSCNKKHNDPDGTTVTTETTTTETTADTTITADATTAEPATSTSDANSKSTRTSSRNAGNAQTDKSKSGYSAADGTDAENNDGDQYTKNDQKPMPTGPPMK